MKNVDEALDHAALARSSTLCFFGKSAKLVAGPVSHAPDGMTQHLRAVVDGLIEFVENIEIADGYVIAHAYESAGATLAALSATVRQTLGALSDYDPAGERCMRAEIDHPSWVFRFAGQSFYPIATAPCYPQDSSRFNGGNKYTHVIMLAQAAFRRRHAPGQTQLPDSARARIRTTFAQRGMGYDLRISLSDQECYKIVKPLFLSDPPVRWWEDESGS